MVRQNSEKLRKLLLAAQFDNALALVKTLDPDVLPCNQSELEPDEFLAALQLRSMAAEVLDYWGDFKRAEDFIAAPASLAKPLLARLRTEKPHQINDGERRLLRQHVWVLLHAGMVKYRNGDLDKASELFNICDHVCEDYVVGPVDRAWGTRARIQYSIALIYRERSDFESARIGFTRSVENAYRSLEKQPQELSKLTYVAIAKNLGLGLAYIHSAVGRPDLAFPLLLSAKSILQPLGEKLISASVDMIYANVLRGIPDDSQGTMDDIIGRLQRCYEIFKNSGHKLYQARATYYLGVAYLQRARSDDAAALTDAAAKDLQRAQIFSDELYQYSEQSEDRRSGLYLLVLKSRIQRKSGLLQEAEKSAGDVIGEVDKSDGIYVDALVARGEARTRRGEFKRALEDFEESLKTTKNPRIAALCLLHVSSLYARLGNDIVATQRMHEFEQVKASVTNVQIKLLEEQARAAIEANSRDLILRMTDTGLSKGKVTNRVRRFLAEWARKNSSNDQEAAQQLGISRQTLHKWSQSTD
jgi:tetratricopeptide (TPR) repeat protein